MNKELILCVNCENGNHKQCLLDECDCGNLDFKTKKHKPELIDLPTTSYQIALKFVEIIENEIKPKLKKDVLTDYDLECVIDLFRETIEVNHNADLDPSYLEKHKIKYCIKCGNEKEPLKLENKIKNIWSCKNGCKN
jgi:hypothetical protein